MTLPPQFLLYIPGRKPNAADPFSSLILMNATLIGSNYILHVDPSGSTTTVRLELPTTQLGPRPKPFRVSILLADNTTVTERWISTLTANAKATKGSTQLQIYSIPHFKEIFPGKILRRNVPITGHGFSDAQLAHFTLPLSLPPWFLAAATTGPSSSSSSLSSSSPAPTPIIPAPRPVKKVVHGPAAMNAYIASQLLAFAQMKGEVCPITAGYYEDKDTAVMPCGHLFSKLAIDETFKKEPNKCPACRAAGAPVIV